MDVILTLRAIIWFEKDFQYPISVVRGRNNQLPCADFAMRKHAEWMTQADERVLEYLNEFGNHQPSAIRSKMVEITKEVDYHSNYLNRRCRRLTDYNMLKNVGGGTYSITKNGELFLSGDLDAAELEKRD